MPKGVFLSINPTYFCNFRCPSCYLTDKQLSDQTTLDLEVLHNRICEFGLYGYAVEGVDIYGGEVTLLDDQYQLDLLALLEEHDITSVNVITNLSRPKAPILLSPLVTVGVSYDFTARKEHERIASKMREFYKPIDVLVLAVPEVIKDYSGDFLITFFNAMPQVRSVRVLPYSANQSNVLEVTNTDFEYYIRDIIDSPLEKKFTFVNENDIVHSLQVQMP